MLTVAVLGFGGRGNVYTQNFAVNGIKIKAVCDPDEKRRQLAAKFTDSLYDDENAFFAAGKLADLLVIATMDSLHYRQVMRALDLGYDILLEKPIALDAQQCRDIEQKAKEKNCKVVVCHVLRYAPFFQKIKELISSGEYGRVMSLQMTESVGYYHFAHSYVRGNWRNKETSAPVILAKSCHDLDIIQWLVDSKCTKLSSFGSTSLFKEDCAPAGSTPRCRDCDCRDSCVFDCYKIYTNPEYERIAGLARHGHLGSRQEEIARALSEDGNLYGRCVYCCDNNVFDNQVVNMEFQNGAHAQFMLTAFTEVLSRSIRVCCEKGEIYGNLEKNTVHSIFFGQEEQVYRMQQSNEQYASHGGGDMGIVLGIIEAYAEGKECASTVEQSVHSHLMCFAAEESAQNGGQVVCL